MNAQWAKAKTNTIIAILAAGIFWATSVVSTIPLPSDAQSGSSLRAEIEQLEKEIAGAEGKADHLHEMAQSLEAAIDDLNADIRLVQKDINLTRLKIKELNEKLEETRLELVRQKEILAKSLREHYKYGSITTLELFITADNFSDFFNQKEYLDRVRESIHESAQEVARLEEQLEEQKAEQEELLKKHEAQKNELNSKKAEKDRLLNETKGEQAKYEAYARRLDKKREDALAELEAWLASQNGNFVSQGRVNAGDIVGYVGSSGSSTGPHLHFELTTNGSSSGAYNPISNGCSVGQTIGNCKLKHGFILPFSNTSYSYNSSYGWRTHPIYGTGRMHNGIDIGSNWGASQSINGAPIKAVGSGDIVQKFYNYGSGYTVIIRHDNGVFSRYFHMQPF